MKRKSKAQLGTIIHGTLRPEDLIPAFEAEIRRLRGALPLNLFRWSTDLAVGEISDSQEYIEALVDELNQYAPPYCYFGTHPGDSSDFGFWFNNDYFEDARADGDLLVVSDLSEADPKDPRDVAVINDHGNVTIYRSGRRRPFLVELVSVV